MSTLKLESKIIKTELINWRDLQFLQQDDFKEWTNNGDKKLLESILKYQFVDPFKVWNHNGINYCLDGKHRFLDLDKVSQSNYEVPELLPATFIDCKNMQEAAELVLVYSSTYAKITQQGLLDFVNKFDLDFPDLNAILNISDFDTITFQGLLNSNGEETKTIIPASLKDIFLVPPFSVLDTRQGDWQNRKRTWSSLFNSQETREDIELIAKSGQSTAIYELRNKMRELLKREPEWDEIIEYAKKKGMHVYEGASIFDPVLCELSYRWFCPEGGRILDPFAGGSVRGVVAGILGFQYAGIDLRKEQVEANRKQAEVLKIDIDAVKWFAGDSNELLDEIEFKDIDFVYSCPPYADLEKYSDDPKDLSNMDYADFKEVYFSIIKKAVAQLKDDRFACFVVGDVRDKKGFYYNFVSDTIEAFKEAGMELYNEIILVNVVGSLAIRVRRQFNGGRKVGKMHQNVLVFYKGDPKKIKENFPELNLAEIDIFNEAEI